MTLHNIMKINPILLAVSAFTLAAPAVIHSAQNETETTTSRDQPRSAPRAGLVTIVDLDAEKDFYGGLSDSRRRIAWKSLTSLPNAEHARLTKLVRFVDKTNMPRAPHATPQLIAPACMY